GGGGGEGGGRGERGGPGGGEGGGPGGGGRGGGGGPEARGAGSGSQGRHQGGFGVGLGRGGGFGPGGRGAAFGRGAGVVIGPGLVVTNAHNLRGAQVTVTFADGRQETGTVAGADVDGDLAVIQVPTGDVEPLARAESPADVR